MIHKIEIQLNKKKIVFLFILFFAITVVGVSFIMYPESSGDLPTIATMILGIFTVLIFGFFTLFFLRKLFDSKVGLIIDENGIINRSNPTNLGLKLIEWADVTNIRIGKFERKQYVFQFLELIEIKAFNSEVKFLVLDTDKPEKYIQMNKNPISKVFMKINQRRYGSSLCIDPRILKVKLSELEELLNIEFNKHTQKASK